MKKKSSKKKIAKPTESKESVEPVQPIEPFGPVDFKVLGLPDITVKKFEFKWTEKQRLMLIYSVTQGMLIATDDLPPTLADKIITIYQQIAQTILKIAAAPASYLNKDETLQYRLNFIHAISKKMKTPSIVDEMEKAENPPRMDFFKDPPNDSFAA